MESFERKLEDAQRALNIAPRDFVPVMYVDETSYVHELVRLIPTMMVVGTYHQRGIALALVHST